MSARLVLGLDFREEAAGHARERAWHLVRLAESQARQDAMGCPPGGEVPRGSTPRSLAHEAAVLAYYAERIQAIPDYPG